MRAGTRKKPFSTAVKKIVDMITMMNLQEAAANGCLGAKDGGAIFAHVGRELGRANAGCSITSNTETTIVKQFIEFHVKRMNA